jgi:gamma-glutamyltranspeptidase / glutathione hydrolase
MVAHNDTSCHEPPLLFSSRRSPILCCNACVATSQPLASSIGLDLLRRGANAADVAIAVAAALAVTEPCSTGLGGDMFCLYYCQTEKVVTCINGSGRSPAALTLEKVRARYPTSTSADPLVQEQDGTIFGGSPLAVTVPGAAQGWEDLHRRHGSNQFSMEQLLEPAALLAEQGFPVAPLTAYHWQLGMPQVAQWIQKGDTTEPIPLCSSTVHGQAPKAGEMFVNPDMARVLRELGRHGAKQGFYEGPTGQAMVQTLNDLGGCLTMDDLRAHTSSFPEPICVEYRGCRLWQAPPNGQGVAGLVALAGLQHLEEQGIVCPPISEQSIGQADTYHVLIEMMRLGFADNQAHVACPDSMIVGTDWLLDKERIGNRAAKLYDPTKAVAAGVPDASSCTVSFQVVDTEGNAVSFVNSNYMGFGTGIVPKGCGFTLQNRGFGFNLQEGHPNSLAPAKRPYHTIIPGILTHADTNELYATLSNMGGHMQPQGHLQLTVDLLAGSMDPQAAIDMPRFCIADGTQNGIVLLEQGMDAKVVEDLISRGHNVKPNVAGHERSVFGRAQIIKRNRETGVLWAGSDGRADGCAIGF